MPDLAMSDLNTVLARVDADLDAAIERLFVTAADEVDLDRSGLCRRTRACAEWHAADLASIGFERACATRPAIRWSSRMIARRRAARCCSTATTTCSRSIRWSSGTMIPSRRDRDAGGRQPG